MAGPHYILREELHLVSHEAIGPAEAPARYAELEHFQLTRLLPALERAMDSLAPDDQTVYLDRLELHLSLSEARSLTDIELEGLVARVAGQMRSSRPQGLVNPLFRYLQSGVFPDRPGGRWTASDIQKITRLILTKPIAAARWRYFHNINPLPPGVPEAFVAEIRKQTKKLNRLNIRRGRPSAGPDNDISALNKIVNPAAAEVGDNKPQSPTNNAGDAPAPPAPAGVERSPRDVSGPDPSREASFTTAAGTNAGGRPGGADEGAIFIADAGLVMLHPYVGWLLDRTATAEDPRRAASLLSAAVWGEVRPEWEWTLPKILLGHDPGYWIGEPAELREDDRAALHELLTGVLDHWGALGSTGPDGLRANFLQREGKLIRRPTGWELTVDARPFDMLLDRLPWSLGMVKTRMMPGVIQVNWL